MEQCKDCIYFGEPTGRDNFHICHNNKSSYKVALATATCCIEYKKNKLLSKDQEDGNND